MRHFAYAIPAHARQDVLTGLFDRQAIFDAIRPGTNPERVGLGAALIVDLDRFSHVNQSLGYRAGDTVLRTIALRLMARIRSTDQVGRLGSDDFLVLLASPVNIHSATEVALRILESMSEPIRIDGQEVVVTGCVGVAMHDANDLAADEMIRRAVTATGRAKSAGAGRMVMATAEDMEMNDERLKLEVALRRAFEHRELEVFYQPEYDLRTGEVLGAEALVRWRHPDHGLLSAGEFIEIVEDTGLASRLGTWVIGQAFAHAGQWNGSMADRTIRINLSAKQLMDDTIVIDVRNALASGEVQPHQVCLEVTESHLLADRSDAVLVMNRLKELGVLIAVDDFGTGFNSMSYLKKLPVDVLKIDKSFIDGIGIDKGDTAIVESIVKLANMLGLAVVAEGVEHERQIAALVEMGCHRAQGFYLGRPMPSETFLELVAD